MSYNLNVTPEVKNRIKSVVDDCFKKASARLGDKLNITSENVDILFSTKGTAAGKARFRGNQYSININPILLNNNAEMVINDTVPHEVAHIIVFNVYNAKGNRVKPHGKEWQYVMRSVFGLPANRTHNYDTSEILAKRNLKKKFVYKCDCRTFNISPLIHRRICFGKKYYCPKCKGPIHLLGEKIYLC